MSKSQLNIRIDDELSGALDKRTESTGKTKTAIVSEALASYLNVSTDKSDVDMLRERLEALERKFHQLKEDDKHQDISFKKPKEKPAPDIDVQDLGKLITKVEASVLTGYSVNTLNRTFSQNDISQVSKRGKAGLYRKDEVLQKIGINSLNS